MAQELTTTGRAPGLKGLLPSPLVAVVLGIVLVQVFDLDQEGVAIVGNIESGVSLPALPGASFDQFTQLLLPALGIALLAYPDSFLTARSMSTAGSYTLDADQEFLALGASNLASGLLDRIGEQNIHLEVDDAVAAYQDGREGD